jgi:mono/diheme cytochrome c family protein
MNATFSSAARRGRWWLAGLAAIVFGVAAVAAVLVPSHRPPPVPVADSGDAAAVLAGRDIYAGHCAVCHGKRLQGQAMWQVDDEESWRRAPALDATGNAWLHGDAALIAMVRNGRFPGVPPGARSAMPAFAGKLADRDIVATLAYVKRHWPVALRVVQAALNPGAAGMPRVAAGAAWQFPLICKGAN